MKIYIAYKYRYTKDKEALKHDLQDISSYLDALGHESFILGRDVQNWAKHTSKVSTTLEILRNIRKYDVLFAYVNSNVHSNGIPVEFAFAKLFGLKVIIARQKDLKKDLLENFANAVILFSDLNDLKAKSAVALARVAQ